MSIEPCLSGSRRAGRRSQVGGQNPVSFDAAWQFTISM